MALKKITRSKFKQKIMQLEAGYDQKDGLSEKDLLKKIIARMDEEVLEWYTDLKRNPKTLKELKTKFEKEMILRGKYEEKAYNEVLKAIKIRQEWGEKVKDFLARLKGR